MKGWIFYSSVAVASVVAAAGVSRASGQGDGDSVPIFEIKLPTGYRDWKLISIAREEGRLDDIRAVLGNDVAIEAYRSGNSSFPDGSIIARLAWSFDPLAESEKAFGSPQSYVAGSPKNGVQYMVKDSRKYAATGGWGYAQFNNGKPGSEAAHKACFSCHVNAATRDFVFARYAP